MFHQEPEEEGPSQAHCGELRREVRHRVLMTGKLIHLHTSISGDCTVRDLSTRGARIAVNPEAVSVGPILIMVNQGLAHEAHTVWQTVSEAGLVFLSSVDLCGDIAPPLRRAGEIWLELRRH